MSVIIAPVRQNVCDYNENLIVIILYGTEISRKQKDDKVLFCKSSSNSEVRGAKFVHGHVIEKRISQFDEIVSTYRGTFVFISFEHEPFGGLYKFTSHDLCVGVQ